MSLIKVIGGCVGTSQESGICVLEEELGGNAASHFQSKLHMVKFLALRRIWDSAGVGGNFPPRSSKVETLQ